MKGRKSKEESKTTRKQERKHTTMVPSSASSTPLGFYLLRSMSPYVRVRPIIASTFANHDLTVQSDYCFCCSAFPSCLCCLFLSRRWFLQRSHTVAIGAQRCEQSMGGMNGRSVVDPWMGGSVDEKRLPAPAPAPAPLEGKYSGCLSKTTAESIAAAKYRVRATPGISRAEV
jgi:hypothetical protein